MQGRLQPGLLVTGRYQVAGLLGAGEMGEVYDVRDTSTGYAYALKLLSAEALQQAEAWNAYQREAQAASALPFETIAKAYEFGLESQSNAAYVLGEFVTLPNLASLLQSSGPLPVAALEAIIRDLAPALDQAHAAGIVHRNLKPQNVFASPDESGIWKVRVSDFGLAHLRKMLPPPPGWVASPGWLCADQVDPGARPAPAMDIYALGLLAFYALTGRSPFMALNRPQLDLNLLWAEMTAPMPQASTRARELGANLSPTFDPWFSKALALSASHRFQSVTEMSRMLFDMVGSSQHVVTMRPPAVATAQAPMSPQQQQPRTAKGTLLMGAGPGQYDPNVAAMQAQAQQAMQAGFAPAQGPAPDAIPPDLTESTPPAPKKKFPIIIPIAIAAAMLVLGVGATGAWFLLLRPKPKPVEARVDPVPAESVSAAATAEPSAAPPVASAEAPAASASAIASAAPADTATPPTDALIKFTCDPECESVKCDGKKVETVSDGLRLAPGSHKCVGVKSGYAGKTETFTVKAGEDQSVTLTLKQVGGGSVAAAPPVVATKPATGGVKTVPAGKPTGQKGCGTFINPCK